MLAKPLLRTETDELEKCILCNRPIQPSEVKQGVGIQGLKTIEEKAKIWAKINIPDDHEMIEFTKVEGRLIEREHDDGAISVHSNCRINFRTQGDKKLKQFGEKLQESQSQPSTDLQDKSVEQSSEKKRQSDRVVKKPKLLCFVCNIVKNTDSKPYNEGGLGRCSEKGSKRLTDKVCVALLMIIHIKCKYIMNRSTHHKL